MYAWWQILLYAVMFGVVVFIVLRGLDWLLGAPTEAFMDKVNARRVRRDLEELDSDGA